MRIPEVKQCCCGCTLETGTLIIGWLQLIGAVLMFIGGIIGVVTGNSVNHPNANKTTLIIGIIAALIVFALAVILLIGTNRKLAKYVHFWVVVETVFLILYIVSSVINGIIMMVNGAVGPGITGIIAVLIGSAISAYFIIVVRSFRNEIRSETQHA